MSWITYRLDGSTLDEKYVNKTSYSVRFNYPCTSTSSCYPYIVTLSPGKYMFECYGASGGNGYVSPGGKGGYSVGSALVEQSTNFYIFVGGQGSVNSGPSGATAAGGYNGGGNGKIGGDLRQAGGGGGATDIRNSTNTLNSRIIVAGGGGGAGSLGYSPYTGVGGNGGGTTGENGSYIDSSTHDRAGKGATQTSVGLQYNAGTDNKGGIGRGDGSSGGGGGGGYFGGGGGMYAGGGGGSGYVGGVSSEFSNKKTVTGINEGSGYAIITLLTPFATTSRSKKPIALECSCERNYPFAFNSLYITILVIVS
jgi:hypothetical protein